MKAEAILIKRSYRQRPGRRALYGLLTFFAWLVWVSLWLPLITLLAWLFGLHTSYIELFVRNHASGWHELLQVGLLSLLCTGIVVGWSTYNWWRFRGLDRRRGRHVVAMAAMAEALGVKHGTAIELRSARRIALSFDADGQIDHQRAGEVEREH